MLLAAPITAAAAKKRKKEVPTAESACVVPSGPIKMEVLPADAVEAAIVLPSSSKVRAKKIKAEKVQRSLDLIFYSMC